MATCPAGHETEATDFCDICGMRIGGPAGGPSLGGTQASAAGGGEPAAGPRETCPNCGADRTGKFCETCGLDFDAAPLLTGRPAQAAIVPEQAGPAPGEFVPAQHPAGPAVAQAETAAGEAALAPGSVAPAAAAPAVAAGNSGQVWTAVVTADRDYYNSVVATAAPGSDPIQFPAYCPERQFRLAGKEMRIGRRSLSRGLEPEIDLTGPPADTAVSHLHAVLLADPDGNWAVLDPGSSNGTQVNGREIATGERVPLHDGDRVSVGGWTVLTIRVT